MEQAREYYAFISYKREDERWARWLQHKLEHYKLPANLNGRTDLPREIRPVFRDTSELNPGNLPQQIHDALEASKFLIVICSPRSAKSEWVDKEIETFIAMGKKDRIIPFIIDGKPFCSSPKLGEMDPEGGGVCNPEEECFPPAIRNLPSDQELLGANITEMGRDAAAVKTVAQMFGVRFDTLWGRYEREQKRRRNWIIAAVAVFVLSVLGVAAYIWNQNNDLKITVSKAMAKDAELLAENGDSYLARKVAVEALDFAYTFEAEVALRHAWERNSTVLKGHTGRVIITTFSPDGKLIASASEDSTIRVWEVATGRCLLTIMDSVRPGRPVFTPDCKSIMAKLNGGALHIWDIETGQCKKTFEHSYSPDGKHILTEKGDTIFIWDAETGQYIQTMAGLSDWSQIKFSPDGKRIVILPDVSSSDDGTIFVWNVETGKCIRKIKHDRDIQWVGFVSDGKQIVTLSVGKHHYEYNDSVRGEYYKSGHSGDSAVRIWDIETGECIRAFHGERLLGISSDGNRIFIMDNGDLCIYYVSGWPAANKELNIMKGDRVHGISPDGNILSMAEGNNIRLLSLEGEPCAHSLIGHTKTVAYVSFSPDGSRLVSASSDNTIRIWDAQTGTCLRILEGHNNAVRSAEFSPDGKYIASASFDTTVRIWDAETGKCLKTFDTIFSKWSSVSFSPDGKNIVGRAKEKGICIVDVETGKIVWTMKDDSLLTSRVKLTPDGRKLVGTKDKTISIFDIKTHKYIQKLQGLDAVNSIDISPDGKLIASSYRDKTIRIWDVETGQCQQVLSVGHLSSLGAVKISPDGRLVAVRSSFDVSYVYDIATGLCVWTFGNGFLNDGIAFSPDGIHIATFGERDGTLEIYDFLPLDELIQKTREQFKDNPLTPEERRQYYLE